MSGMQTGNGKAFEYVCVDALYKALSASQSVTIEDTPQIITARKSFNGVSDTLKSNFIKAADAAARIIIRLEPQLEYPDKNIPLFLSLQADARGKAGDVRDVLCIRKQNNWEIGLSCKHNHHAVKHCRLSANIDFGKEWFGAPCSRDYFDNIKPLFDELKQLRERSNRTALWSNVKDKSTRFYVPVLRAFITELERIDKANPNVVIPQGLISYLIGRHDFYKVIANDAERTTRIECVNLYGTLNRQSGSKCSIVNVKKLKLPKRFRHVDFKDDSKNTIEITCDEGWVISMRIHSASSKVEPSLKFDVNLVALPSAMHSQVEPW